MRKILFLAVLIPFSGFASHIVGGEFELLHRTGNTYRLNLIIYFDLLNGAPGAKDLNATVSIFRKSDNGLMDQFTLLLASEDRVSYTQPSCSQGEIVTNKLVYTRDIELPSSQYNHPLGYYVSWQRCCRNYDISNIYSELPGPGARSAGQTFYLEFPPVVVDGAPFINSSPRLFPPLNDYACPRRPYYADFAGKDDDGDSLAYTLVTPLNTKTFEALPPAGPAPYPNVTWRPGYSLEEVTGGAPDLSITPDGLLTVTPKNQGLYVFAVKCDEFRNGRKIGETRRDFQMLVLDRCPRAVAPVITGKKLTDSNFTYREKMAVTFPVGTPDEARCITVKVSDEDSKSADDLFKENIKIRVVGLNFKDSKLNEVLPAVTTAVLSNGSTKEFKVCFPECPYFIGGSYELGLIAQDDACSLPLSDTLRVEVDVQLPPNRPPVFTTPDVTATLTEGDRQTWPVEVYDPDGDSLDINRLAFGFSPESKGMKFQYNLVTPDRAVGTFTWDALCDLFDFSGQTDFKVNLLAGDLDYCRAQPDEAVMELSLKVILPGNADPVIDSDLDPGPSDRLITGIKKEVFENLAFSVTGEDLKDNDQLELTMTGKGFNPASYGMTFQNLSGRGSLKSMFTWNPNCTNVNPAARSEFDLLFLVVDNSNKCRLYKADTLEVRMTLAPPANRPPSVSFQPILQDVTVTGTTMTGKPGDEFRFRIIGTDADETPVDNMTLALQLAAGNVTPAGFQFSGATGKGSIESLFTWRPGCEAFSNGVWENTYTFRFRVNDDRCYNAKANTIDINIILKDPESTDTRLLLPNVVTPNGDGLNEYFAVDDEEGKVRPRVNLPLDNCNVTFENVLILNRWGKTVYRSSDRFFKWYPKPEDAGVYYYVVNFNTAAYKGVLTVQP